MYVCMCVNKVCMYNVCTYVCMIVRGMYMYVCVYMQVCTCDLVIIGASIHAISGDVYGTSSQSLLAIDGFPVVGAVLATDNDNDDNAAADADTGTIHRSL